jgi:hypothetical protein
MNLLSGQTFLKQIFILHLWIKFQLRTEEKTYLFADKILGLNYNCAKAAMHQFVLRLFFVRKLRPKLIDQNDSTGRDGHESSADKLSCLFFVDVDDAAVSVNTLASTKTFLVAGLSSHSSSSICAWSWYRISFLRKEQPPYTIAGFDLTAHIFADRDDSTIPRHQRIIEFVFKLDNIL